MGHGCTHKGITKVMVIGGCEIYAGSESQVAHGGHLFDLVVSLTGHPNRKPLKFRMSRGSARMFSALNDYAKRRTQNLIIDWPDMQAPPFDADFWTALYTDLSKMKGRVVFHCMGGHGRTGTALAILAFLNKSCGEQDAVQWVRSVYCEEAVETSSQVDYLRHTMGMPVAVKASRGWSGATSPSGGSQSTFERLRDEAQQETREISKGPSKYFGGKTTGYGKPKDEVDRSRLFDDIRAQEEASDYTDIP